MNKPIICLHRVTEEQGEKCDFCNEPQTLYLTLEQPLRFVVCLKCVPKVIKKFVPPQHIGKVEVLMASLKDLKDVAHNALAGLKR